MTASPLLLHHADDVILLEGGKATTRGRHVDLLASSAAYRSVVVRGEVAPSHQPTPEDQNGSHPDHFTTHFSEEEAP